MADEPPSLDEADYVVLIEALAAYGGNPNETATFREERAWELIDRFGERVDGGPAELLRRY